MQQPLPFGRVGSCLWALRGAGMSAESLENYLQLDSMEEGNSKDELQILVDSVENNDYVTKQLQVAFDAYVASHVHEDLRKMDVVMRRVRQEFALKNLAKVMSDYMTIAAFVPDVKVEDAHEMSSAEAQALVDRWSPNSLELFKTNLQGHLDGARASILHENPMLTEEGMEVIVEDMVAEAKQKVYYKQLQIALDTLETTGTWQFVPKVDPNALASTSEKSRSSSSQRHGNKRQSCDH